MRVPEIPASLMPHIFDLFVQGSRKLDRAKGGLGIGLAFSRLVVERHGGSIRAEGALAGGCRVTLRLPLARPAG